MQVGVSEQVSVSSGSVFVVSARNGDVRPGTREGFYAHDTRFLSAFRLSVQGRTLEAVGGSQLDHFAASFYTSSRGGRNLPPGTISVVRDRYVGEGLHEDISLVNHSPDTRSVRLVVTFNADFADIFEVRRAPLSKQSRVTTEAREGQHLCLVYRRRTFHRETWISFSNEPQIEGKRAIFNIVLPPKSTWKTCVSILPVLETPPSPMKCAESVLGQPFGAYRYQREPPPTVRFRHQEQPWPKELPVLETEEASLREVYQQAIGDLRSLQMEYEPGNVILAAGLPWFMAVFGRDSIIAAIQTKLLGPELMTGTLHTLSGLQATTRDRFREADPGKIPHEVRRGELSVLERFPHSRYYGSVDATPLFVRLLWEAYHWTGDEGLLQRLLPAAEAALRWIDHYGDLDGDGFIEYERRTRHGLRNQGWKDSDDAISFADGRLAEGRIAPAEVQGYAYAAKRAMAQVYRVLGRPGRARTLERAADELRRRFNEAFWMPEEGTFALALDGHKQQVDSVASNAGQCLWSGIVDEDKAPKVVERLMAPDMFSGWGIRTLSTQMARYHPLSYHNGTVWPHDNSLIAAGMSAYGFREQANAVAQAILDAAWLLPDHRLPELFAGYPRRGLSFPVPFRDANVPQAWACGAVIYLLETLLGVVPAGDRLLREATANDIRLSLSGVRFRGARLVL